MFKKEKITFWTQQLHFNKPAYY